MKRSPIMLPFVLSVIALSGGAVGYGLRNLSGKPGQVSQAGDSRAGRSGRGGESTTESAEETGRGRATKLPVIPHKKSDDTVESLLALDPGMAYGRVAAWLADAGEQDIAAYWKGYQGGKRTNDLTDLVFLNWTRANPQAAIAAVAGTKDEHYAWWAWAAHDPKKALAEAMANNPDRVNNVTWGIGEFHPEWFRENFDKLPEHARGNAMAGMRKWTDRQDPEGSLDFMRKHDQGFDRETFLSLVRKDPWAAQDWLKRNPSQAGTRYSGEDSVTALMVRTIASERPEDLERMMAATPAGETRRKMEEVVYQQLVADDPDAALEFARKGEVPLAKVQQLAQVGIKVLQKDPEQAFALAAEMLEAAGGKLGYETRVEYSNGSSSWGGSQGKGSELVDALFIKDRARTLELVKPGENQQLPQVFHSLINRWGEEDLTGLSEWANRQTDPAMKDAAAINVVNQLAQRGEFVEAIEWAESTGPNYRGHMVPQMVSQWAVKDPAAAEEWLEQSTLPEDQKKSLRDLVKRTLEADR
ncbi:MAG: hypothetical protein EOP88_09430 [Verrucomicrobiaceae bacterium]|nr:MAG: hypothetical protein EOP88_09430 [Verrucomicrobiaceae bacterium]